jgi:uncharacterized protein (DUF885 family)
MTKRTKSREDLQGDKEIRKFCFSPCLLTSLFLTLSCASAPVAPVPGASIPVAPLPTPRASVAAPSDDVAIAQAERDYVALIVAISPETATALGDHSRDTDLDAYSLEGEEDGLRKEEAMLASLRDRFPAPHASRASLTDLDLLRSALAVDVRWRRELKPLQRNPTEYSEPMHAVFLQAAREYAPAAERARASLARIEQIPGILDQARKNLRDVPRPWAETGVLEARSAGDFFTDEQRFLLVALPGDKEDVIAAVAGARQAYADYATFLEHDVLPHARGDFAAGRGFFEFFLREGYFLQESPDALYDLGKRIFDATQAEMDAVAKRIDPRAKSWPEVTRVLKAHHPTAADLIPSYRREVERARKFLVDKDVAPFPPGDDCQVQETPPFQRSTTVASYEVAPPLDPVTRGFFYVTPVDRTLPAARQEQMLRENDHGDQVDTVVHETYPGHHLQLSYARTSPSVMRKLADLKRALLPGSDLFAEGWGLYSEELMGELGYYTDEERLMQLEWTLVRAARVMIDVSLHTRGMGFEEAVKMLTDQVHLEHELAVSEVRRYTMTPGQPLAYLVGRERILAMRERTRQKLGSAFSLKAFHTELLSHGTIAQGLIEREMF